MRSLAGVSQVIADGEALPPHEVRCPLMSLPLLFDTALTTIPAGIPYLFAKESEVARWRERLRALHPTSLKVGIVWAGNPRQRFDADRSMPLAAMAPLASVEGVHFLSLQQGPPAQQIHDAPAGLPLIDWTADLTHFKDAALITALDLVLTVDTATAHLAGALGRPVWVMLPWVADWRWLTHCDDSPWYPTMRLFRQRSAGDWAGVLQRVTAALRERVGAGHESNG